MNPLTKKRHCVVYAKPSNARMNLEDIYLVQKTILLYHVWKNIGKSMVGQNYKAEKPKRNLSYEFPIISTKQTKLPR